MPHADWELKTRRGVMAAMVGVLLFAALVFAGEALRRPFERSAPSPSSANVVAPLPPFDAAAAHAHWLSVIDASVRPLTAMASDAQVTDALTKLLALRVTAADRDLDERVVIDLTKFGDHEPGAFAALTADLADIH